MKIQFQKASEPSARSAVKDTELLNTLVKPVSVGVPKGALSPQLPNEPSALTATKSSDPATTSTKLPAGGGSNMSPQENIEPSGRIAAKATPVE